jgi:actin-related protein
MECSGLAERVKRELVQLFPMSPGLKVTPDPANPEPGSNWQRKKASWIGGSMFASLDTFHQVSG